MTAPQQERANADEYRPTAKLPRVEVLIGVQLTTRELKVDVPDDQADALRNQVQDLFADGAKPGVLWVTDKDGRTIGVPSDKLAYVEIGSDRSSRAVGFSSRS
jgi:hypothetical protein